MRYLGLTQQDRQDMMEAIGVASIDALYKFVPQNALGTADIALADHTSEQRVEREISNVAQHNISAKEALFFLGAGCYYHHIPASVDHIIQRSEFLTSYTPYQPEISQGTLTALFEFQTMVARLTGMDIANASLYDGATATAEAARMAIRINKRNHIHIRTGLHPHYKEVLDTYKQFLTDVRVGLEEDGDAITEETSCVIVQTPDFFGTPHALAELRQACDAVGALLIVVVTEVVSLGLLPAPKEADIVVGEGQSLGNSMGFGGPHLGLMACKKEYMRQMPGRLCGETVDADGKRSFVLTLNTREQHIRRDKATSNICTNQGLCALAFTIHLSLLGEIGFKQLARLNHARACQLADALDTVEGVSVENTHFFNEFVVQLPFNAAAFIADMARISCVPGLDLGGNRLLVAATEMTSEQDIKDIVAHIASYRDGGSHG